VPDGLAFEDFPPGEIVDYGGIEVSADETSSLRASSTRNRSTSTTERRARPSAAEGFEIKGRKSKSTRNEIKAKGNEIQEKREAKPKLISLR
jgi:hypothetical protein